MELNTEVIDRLELIIAGTGIIIGLFFSAFLLFKKSDFSKANLFLACYLFVFSSKMTKSVFYDGLLTSNTIDLLFLGSLLLVGPSLWCYSLLLLKKSLTKKELILHYSPFLLWICIFGLIPHTHSFFIILFIHSIVYSSMLIYKHYASAKKSKIKQWILLLSGVTIAMLCNSILVFFKIVPFYPTSAFLFSACIIQLSIYALNNLTIFKSEQKKYVTSNLAKKEAEALYAKLKTTVENDQLYLDPDLSLAKLSKLVGISPKELSQVINQIEQKNYSQYITTYRIKEAKKLLKDPTCKNYKISTIAYESGFNSISSFNSAFKKITQKTAVQFRDE